MATATESESALLAELASLRQRVAELEAREMAYQLTEATLRESEDKYRAFFQSSKDAILLTSPDGTIQTANPAACQMLGRTEAEICALGRSGLVDLNDPRLAVLLEERTRTGKVHGELTMLRNDGTPFPVEMSSTFFHDRQGNIRTSMVIRDITERKKAETALRQSEERFARAFRASPAALAISRLDDGTILDANEKFLELTGYSHKEVLGRTIFQLGFTRPDSWNLVGQVMQSLNRSLRDMEITIRTKSGEERTVLFSLERLDLEQGPCLLSILYDITERRRAEEALRTNEQKLRTLFALLPVGISILDQERHVVETNPALQEILGLSDQELAAGSYTNRQYLRLDGTPLPPGEFPTALAVREQREVLNTEIGIVKEDGETIWTSVSAVPVTLADWRVVTAIIDITQRVRAEEKLRALLQEKEVLLREVNHRVKNNLQAVSNLLYIQALQIEDPVAREKFEATQNRVKSIALIHQKLYQTKDFTRVQFAEYVDSLARELIHTYRVDPALIKLTVVGEGLFLNVDTAVTLGIIVNELISNILKHAFPSQQEGEIRIELKSTAGSQLQLIVFDNGVGFPPDRELAGAGSLGLQLVEMLVGHMRGTIELEQDNGTRFTITFEPIPETRS